MTAGELFNGVVIVLSAVGFGGVVSGVTVRLVGKKMDRNEARREEREKARIEEITLLHEGERCTEHAIEAVAAVVTRHHGPDKTVDTAMEYLCDFKEKKDTFIRLQAAKNVHGNA